ncbi:hypothetical protein [Rhodococcus rhodochrous]|uniref:Uncharacterized protein n=1 Tax=Rhodococcus rhodochrous J45 TaxID=935266 RepID=A0A562E5P3_RHORH|nr:hypothetical protein L618_000200000790 [Rhodococcus rhodochrous J45]
MKVYEVKVTHRVLANRRLACEIYPEVFVVDNGAVISTYAGPANGYCPCEPVEPEVDEVFEMSERQLKGAIRWATSIYRPWR